jgi:DNA-binding MurR/RpiR family transcriptional regulator
MLQKKKHRITPPLNVSERISLLSPKRQEIIREVFDRPREYVLHSVRSLAQHLDTDPATLVRIVRGMKFASYRDFQHYLHELSIANATSLDTMRDGNIPGRASSDQVRVSLDVDVKNLNHLLSTLEVPRVTALARRMHTARQVLLLGGDLASHLVKFFEHHLMILGMPVCAATTAGEVVHKARHIGKGDMVLAVSYGRGLRQTVEGLRQARENGAYCVGVTNTLISPINQFAHESFLTSVDTPSFGSSYVAPMAFFNALITACGNYRRHRTLRLMKKLDEEQRRGFRWYES